jgi:hypothetical protein
MGRGRKALWQCNFITSSSHNPIEPFNFNIGNNFRFHEILIKYNRGKHLAARRMGKLAYG